MRLQKSKLLSQLADLDSILESREMTEEEIVKKATAFMEYEERLQNEGMAWRQRSRALWLKEGHEHQFSHQTANAHKRCNCIDQIMVQEETKRV